MSKVARRHIEAVKVPFAPVPEVIDELERLLAAAKSGKLRACAWAVVYHNDIAPDGDVDSGFARGPWTAFALTDAIERLRYRWQEAQYGKE